MSFEYFISNRYLKSKKRSGFISFTTFFSFIVIFLGTACLTVILSIMNGFESIVIERFLAFDSHVRLLAKGETGIDNYSKIAEELNITDEVLVYSPFVQEKAMLETGKGRQVITLKGIDVESVNGVSKFNEKIVAGTENFKGIDGVTEAKPGIILGRGVADNLGLLPGEEVTIWNLKGLARYLQRPTIKTFVISGIIESELGEIDNYYTYVELPDAQRLFRMGNKISGIDINAHHIDDSNILAEVLRAKYNDEYNIRTWYDMRKNLFSSMELEKWAALVVLSLMILVASFSIACALIMLVLEKRKEIGILKSMGCSDKGIRNIFLINGLTIGGAGTFFGLLTGFSICFFQQKYEFIQLPPAVYIIDSLPIAMEPLYFVLVGIIALVLTYMASVYPSKQASKMIPSKALKYE